MSGPGGTEVKIHVRDDTLVFRRASVGHNLGDGIERMPPITAHRQRKKARRSNLTVPNTDNSRREHGAAGNAGPPRQTREVDSCKIGLFLRFVSALGSDGAWCVNELCQQDASLFWKQSRCWSLRGPHAYRPLGEERT
jgi:hypothetical protein